MRPDLRVVSAFSIIACYVFYFFEWLFFVTKPSMFSVISAWDSVRVLLISPIPLIIVCLLIIAAIGLLGKLFRRPRFSIVLSSVAMLIPALVTAAAAFLLIENFTYTLFGFNTGSFEGSAHYIYILIILILIGLSFRYLSIASQNSLWLVQRKVITYIVWSPLLVSIIITLFQYEGEQSLASDERDTAALGLPNILILSSDGVNANRMSAYGYQRDTTPFISSLLGNALMFENAFTNAVPTTGSIGALLSGKLPTTTRVVMRPDTFSGNDSFLHLPGLLRNMGYRTADISIRYYADAYDLNMKQAFDYANGRRISDRFYSRLPLSVQISYTSELRFIEDTSERLQARLLHSAGLQKMVNPYEKVTQQNGRLTNKDWSDDSVRVEQLIEFMDESAQPFFAHIHLLGTHGTYFYPRQRVFSANQQQKRSKDPYLVRMPMVERRQLRRLDWMDDFYDDAVLDYDRYASEIIGHLEVNDQLDNTVIVLVSDHGAARAAHERIPLIIRFPRSLYTGRTNQNVQRIDIAPTILDFLGAPVPEWMEGDTLLGDEIDPLRPVFSVGVNAKHAGWNNGWWGVKKPEAPFYSMGSLSMVHCQIWYFLSMEDGVMTSQEVEGHTSLCSENELLTMTSARQLMVQHLVQRGYGAESLLEGDYKPSPFSEATLRGKEQEIVASSDKDVHALLLAGHTFYRAGNYPESLHSWKQAMNLEPNNPVHSNNVAVALIALKKYEQAIQMLEVTLASNPDVDLYRNNMKWAQSLLAAEAPD